MITASPMAKHHIDGSRQANIVDKDFLQITHRSSENAQITSLPAFINPYDLTKGPQTLQQKIDPSEITKPVTAKVRDCYLTEGRCGTVPLVRNHELENRGERGVNEELLKKFESFAKYSKFTSSSTHKVRTPLKARAGIRGEVKGGTMKMH